MPDKIKRRRYLVNLSLQFRYIILSVLPALVMSIFCIYFIIQSGQLILKNERNKLLTEFNSVNITLQQALSEDLPKEARDRIEITKMRLASFKDVLGIQYYHLAKEWAEAKILLLAVLLVVLSCVGVLSLIYSHRIAGPIYRLQKAVTSLREGKDSGVIKIRKNDELQELSAGLENLRVNLKEKGYLK
ncbi:MAG: hypothetical protein WC478_06005 [Candidatus Omnitrophota bacterium]